MSQNGVLGPSMPRSVSLSTNEELDSRPIFVCCILLCGGACFTFVWGAFKVLDLGALEEEHDEGTC
jgi:hypothetical protein